MRIALGPQDRERYGLPEWIELDPGRLNVDEAEAFERVYSIGPDAWLKGLRDDGTGRPYPTLDARGDPVGVATLVRCRTWMAVHRAGAQVALEDFTFNLLECRSDALSNGHHAGDAADGESGPGKEPSPRKSPRTRSRSR
jgi:hypothetical protein